VAICILLKRIIKISWKDEKKKLRVTPYVWLSLFTEKKNKEILRKRREKRHFNACA